MKIEEILNQASKRLGVSIRNAGPNDNVPDNSSIICDTEIVIGKYDRSCNRDASAFHELGHFVCGEYEDFDPRSVMQMEAEAWKCGIEIAESYGYEFSPEAIKHMIDCLMTYEGK